MSATLEMHGDVAVITMDDGKRNAINPTMVNSINASLDEAESKAKCVVLTGRAGTFSAGFDLKFFLSQNPDDIAALVLSGGDLVMRLMRYPMPVVAASTGHGIAMGTFLLLACDFRYGIPGEFAYGANETQNNMVIPMYAIELIKERVPQNYRVIVAAEGRLLTPDVAVQYGILDELVGADALQSRVMANADALSKTNTYAFTQNRLLVRKAALDALDVSMSVPLKIS